MKKNNRKKGILGEIISFLGGCWNEATKDLILGLLGLKIILNLAEKTRGFGHSILIATSIFLVIIVIARQFERILYEENGKEIEEVRKNEP